MNRFETSIVLGPDWCLPAARAHYRYYEADENPGMACVKRNYLHVVAIFRSSDGSEISVDRMTSIKFTGDDDGRLRLVSIRTLNLEAANRFKEGMEGTLQERFTDQQSKSEVVYDTPGILKVVSVMPCIPEDSMVARATINLVPRDRLPAQS